MIRAIVVDDEPAAINSLTWELHKFADTIKIIDTFTSANGALSGINYLKPDCVFLDIEMPEMNGFELLQKLEYRDFAIIITTAYNQYAIKAIKESALDYLLKPVDGDDIKDIISKLERLNPFNNFQKQFQKTLDTLSNARPKQMIQFPVNGKILFIKIDDIIYCESDGNYTKIFLESAKNIYVSKKLKDIEQMLPKSKFFRTHNSFIVHILKIVEFIRGESHVALTNGKKVPVSRAKKDGFLSRMNN